MTKREKLARILMERAPAPGILYQHMEAVDALLAELEEPTPGMVAGVVSGEAKRRYNIVCTDCNGRCDDCKKAHRLYRAMLRAIREE